LARSWSSSTSWSGARSRPAARSWTRLAQVLLNLLNNAAKYTDPGGRIWLAVRREEDQIVISVRDTGVGIPAEMLTRVFDIFTQVERSQGGLGIGLTPARQLVEMHGGTLSAHSEGVGQGSELVASLPAARSGACRQLGPPATAAEASSAVKRLILVVDDNRDSAESLATLLRMLGHEVHTAHDGLEALAAASALRPDAVFMDIGLPKLNGYEAGRRVRQERGDDVVLITLTGWGQQEDRRRSREVGFDHHLTKLVELATLHQLPAATIPSDRAG
jgi:CheY-like chemotaxis protein